jgi:hypothetical protein
LAWIFRNLLAHAINRKAERLESPSKVAELDAVNSSGPIALASLSNRTSLRPIPDVSVRFNA